MKRKWSEDERMAAVVDWNRRVMAAIDAQVDADCGPDGKDAEADAGIALQLELNEIVALIAESRKKVPAEGTALRMAAWSVRNAVSR